jgi:hypothetical protein
VRRIGFLALTGVLLVGCGTVIQAERQDTTLMYQTLREDKIINADIWDSQPKMLAAGLGFTNIIGVPGRRCLEYGLLFT